MFFFFHLNNLTNDLQKSYWYYVHFSNKVTKAENLLLQSFACCVTTDTAAVSAECKISPNWNSLLSRSSGHSSHSAYDPFSTGFND